MSDVSTDILRYLEVKVQNGEHTPEECLALEYIRSLQEKVTGLTNSLREYGRHQEGCNAQFGDKYRCRCGWREVLDAVGEGA